MRKFIVPSSRPRYIYHVQWNLWNLRRSWCLQSIFFYPCGYHETALREFSIVKLLDELARLGDDRNDLIIWSGIEQFEKCSEHEFLSECRHTYTLRSCFSLFWALCLSPILTAGRGFVTGPEIWLAAVCWGRANVNPTEWSGKNGQGRRVV